MFKQKFLVAEKKKEAFIYLMHIKSVVCVKAINVSYTHTHTHFIFCHI